MIFLFPEKDREKLRSYLRDLSRGENSLDYLQRDILKPHGDTRMDHTVRAIGSILASFGIHGCSGCGADPEQHFEKYKYVCTQCNGSSWMHEYREEIPDPNAPFLVCRVLFIPGKFDGHPINSHPLWWEGHK